MIKIKLENDFFPLESNTQIVEKVVAFTELLVPAKQTRIITAMPQNIFKGHTLVIEPEVARRFLINDIKVGNYSLMLNCEPISAYAFTPRVVDRDVITSITWPSCEIGNQMQLTVTNFSNADTVFKATVFGKSVDMGLHPLVNQPLDELENT